MRQQTRIDKVPGGEALVGWFGGLPSFHDGSLVRLSFDGVGSMQLVAAGFRMTNQTDQNGYYILDRHFVATFSMEDVFELNVAGDRVETIIGHLFVGPRPDGDGFDLELGSIVGLDIRLSCKRLSVSFEPGQGGA